MTRTIDTAENVPADRKRSVWKPLAAAGIGGAVLVATGFGVFAQLSATATGAQVVDSGTLLLRLADNGAGFSAPVSTLAPNDVANRHVTLTNTGTLEGRNLRVQALATTPNLLVDGTRGLQAVISTCPTAWVPGTGLCGTGATATTGTKAYEGSVAGLATAQALSAAAIAPVQGQVHLQVKLSLPDATETTVNGVLPTANTIQNLTNTLNFTFTEDQRAGVTTTS